MNSNNVYNAIIEYWGKDKSKTPNTLQSLIGANPIRINVELSNIVNRTIKSIVSDNGEYYLECNNTGSLIGYGDKVTGVILEHEHLSLKQCNLETSIAIVQTLPEIDVILKDIKALRASRIPEIPESVIEVISDCFHKLNGNGGYANVTADNLPYNDYILTISYRIMLSNVLYSINNGKAINNEYNAYSLSVIAKQIKSCIIKYRLVKDTLPKNVELPIQERLTEWCISPDLSLEDKLKGIGIY